MARACLISCLMAALAAASDSRGELFAIKVDKQRTKPLAAEAANDGFYLAPELRAAEAAEASVAGITDKGAVVLSGNREAIEEAPGIAEASEVDERKVDKVQVIVGLQQDQDIDEVRQSLEEAGYRVVDFEKRRSRYERGRYLLAESRQDSGAISAKMVSALSDEIRESGASSATPNYRVRLPKPQRSLERPRASAGAAAVQPPNDEFYDLLWGMENIHARDAWEAGTDSPIVVAVIDTGVDYDHPDLQGNIWENPQEAGGAPGVDDDGNGFVDDERGWNFEGDNNDPMDDNVHGTHCAGTIGAVQDPKGVVGVTWKVQLMPLKFLSASGSGSLADAVDCINYAADNGAKVLSNSWGGGGFSPVMEDAIENANAKQALFVAAAGNDSTDNDVSPHYPSSYEVENVVAVASIDEGDGLSSFSCFGLNSVDLGAPGGDILSCVPGGGHEFFSGTSMATPHVSGAAALIYACDEHQNKSPAEIKQVIMNSARPVTGLSGKCVTGGVLDVKFLKNCAGPPQGGGCCTVVASTKFAPGQATLPAGGGILAQVDIDLPAEADVVVTANTSASSQGDDVLLDTSLFSSTSTTGWNEAFRFITVGGESRWTGVTISHTVRLPAGQHTIAWVAFCDPSSALQYDGGSLSAIATYQHAGSTAVASAAGARTGVARQGQLRRRQPGQRPAADQLRQRSLQQRKGLLGNRNAARSRTASQSASDQRYDAAAAQRRAEALETRGRLERMPEVRE